jgi:hypothetical protein
MSTGVQLSSAQLGWDEPRLHASTLVVFISYGRYIEDGCRKAVVFSMFVLPVPQARSRIADQPLFSNPRSLRETATSHEANHRVQHEAQKASDYDASRRNEGSVCVIPRTPIGPVLAPNVHQCVSP